MSSGSSGGLFATDGSVCRPYSGNAKLRRSSWKRRFQTLPGFPRTSPCPVEILRDNRHVDFKRFKFKNFFLGLGFCVIPGAMLVLLARDAAVTEYAAYLRGVETPCTITSAEVRQRQDNGINREVAVRFQYEVSGKSHDGEWVGPVMKRRSPTPEEIDAVLAEHRPGTSSTCRINPDTPEEALLHADFPWAECCGAAFVSLFLIFGLCLSLSALGVIEEPKTWFAGEKAGKRIGLFAGLLFAGVGYVMLFSLWKNTLTRPDITAWKDTPCVIDAASIRKFSGNKGRISRQLEVRYTYRFGDKAYRGAEIRPGMTAATVSGETDPLVSRYAQGAHVTCRVNPENPSRAVLEGPVDDTGMLVLGTLFFGVFAAIGTLLSIACARSGERVVGKGYSKFFMLVFIGGIAAVFITAAIVVPNIRVQGVTTGSWLVRALFGLFAVVVCAVVARSAWRQIDETPSIPPKASKPSRRKTSRR